MILCHCLHDVRKSCPAWCWGVKLWFCLPGVTNSWGVILWFCLPGVTNSWGVILWFCLPGVTNSCQQLGGRQCGSFCRHPVAPNCPVAVCEGWTACHAYCTLLLWQNKIMKSCGYCIELSYSYTCSKRLYLLRTLSKIVTITLLAYCSVYSSIHSLKWFNSHFCKFMIIIVEKNLMFW